jgi:hypothetical protein
VVDHALGCVGEPGDGCRVCNIQLYDRHVAAERVLQLLSGALLPHCGDDLVAALLELLGKLQGQRKEDVVQLIARLAVL